MAANVGTGMKIRRKLIMAFGAGALAVPLSAMAQAPAAKLARIGLLGPGSASGNEPWVTALRANLRDLGYVEGSNLGIEFRWAEGKNDRLPELAAELVRSKVDPIVTCQTP
jgi:putative ABC transport system substrate-binding protein